jgi:TPR repeat protein
MLGGFPVQEMRRLRQAAERGDGESQCMLGMCYAHGRGVAQSWTEAVRHWRQAAEQGFEPAHVGLGLCLMQGLGVAQDLAAAARSFRLSADDDDAEAQYWLALLCECGKGMKRDLAEAVRWYRAAAEQDHLRAIVQLGILCEKGMGVAQSDGAAAARYAAASALGGAEELFASGVNHLDQISERDAPEAFTIQLAVRDLVLAGRLRHAGAAAKLASISSRREVASACCMGCGATRKLNSCGKCNVSQFCDRACQAKTWPTHKPSCQQWRDEGKEEVVVDLATLPIKELKRRLDRLKISYAGVLERAELVALFENSQS